MKLLNSSFSDSYITIKSSAFKQSSKLSFMILLSNGS